MTTWIIDLDNTVIKTGVHYRHAVETAAAKISTITNLPMSQVVELIDMTDKLLIAGRGDKAFLARRFADAIELAASQCDVACGVYVPAEDLATEALKYVEEAKYEVYPGVLPVLATFKDRGDRLVLWSKGEPYLQLSKIDSTKLSGFFADGDVFVTLTKDVDVLKYILMSLGEAWDDVIVVGDSYRDEIHAAEQLNVRAIHVTATGHGPPGYESGARGAECIREFADLGNLQNGEAQAAGAA